MRAWLVTADDRTGALEVAAEIAASAGPVVVSVGDPPDDDGVVDLGSRHLSPEEASAVAAAAPVAAWNAHKIDSTLRGNWAAEVRARARVTGQRVVLVPAWPAMGRTCVDGVVHVHGAPLAAVHAHLPEAERLSDARVLAAWLERGGSVASVDVVDEESMRDVAAALAEREVLVVGPAGPIGAVFTARRRPSNTAASVRCELPALVVRGSATDVSRRQMELLAAAHPAVDLVEAPPAAGELNSEVAREVADRARAQMAEHRYATVVIIGGDTAAAVLGPAPRRVGGVVAPGMPWSRDGVGEGPLVVTKAGGFGQPEALADLFNSG